MKLQTKKLIMGVLLVLFMSAGCRAQDKGPAFPEGCTAEGFKFRGKELILNDGAGGSLNLFLIHNTAEETVYINHEPKNNPGASAGWSTELGSGNWSAIAMSTENFWFTCGKMVPGKFGQVSCSQELKVCKFTNPVFNQEDSGSYWVSENKTLDAILETIKARGIEVSK